MLLKALQQKYWNPALVFEGFDNVTLGQANFKVTRCGAVTPGTKKARSES